MTKDSISEHWNYIKWDAKEIFKLKCIQLANLTCMTLANNTKLFSDINMNIQNTQKLEQSQSVAFSKEFPSITAID